MLILTRKTGETIRIGDNVTLRVIDISKGSVKLGIEAPENVTILREEVYERIMEANIASARGGVSGLFKAADILKKKTSGTSAGGITPDKGKRSGGRENRNKAVRHNND